MDQAGSSRRLAAEREAVGRPAASARSSPAGPPGQSSRPVVIQPPTTGPNGVSGASSAPVVTAAELLHPLEHAKSLRGESLDHFTLEDYVGIGGMGTVFRAHDKILNRTVAVKVLSRDQAHDIETIRRFRNEAQSAARLDHENIARVYYMGEARDLPYIVFEFIEGVNLRDLVADRGPVATPDAVSYVLQIAGALAHASSREVVHRDIKPSNILVAPDGKAKLVDMGLARLHDMAVSNDLTASGVTLGTFDYISPEQARNPRTVDVRSDIYSLGCSFFYILTGRPPFPNGTVFQKLLQHQGEAPPDPREFNSEIDAESARIMRKMMAKDPAARYQTCDELIRDLMMLAGNLGLRQLGPSGLVWVAPESLQPSFLERHLPWAAPVIGLILAVIVLEWLPSYNVESLGPLGPTGPSRSVAEVNSGDSHNVGDASGSRTPSQPSATGDVEPIGRASPVATSDRSNGPGTTSVGPFATTPGGRRTSPSTESPNTPNNSTANNGATANSGSSGANGSAKTPTTSSPMSNPSGEAPTRPVPASVTFGDYIVRRPNGGEAGHNSLAAACAASETGDVIELRFHGRRIERPVVLQNKTVELTAAPNVEPIVTFQHDIGAVGEPTTHMITIVGGKLTARGIGFEAPVARDAPAITWSLIRTRGAVSLDFQKCWLAMANPSNHLHASFIEIGAVPGAEAMLMVDPAMPTPDPVRIVMSNVLAFGQAVFLRSDEQQPVDLLWENGWMRLSQPFLEVDGGATAPVAQQFVRAVLKRITADVRGGLARMTYGDSGAPPLAVSLDLQQCVVIGNPTTPMIEQVAAPLIDDARLGNRFEWRARDVYFENLETFWRIEPIVGSASDWRFLEWSNHWGNLEQRAQKDTLPWASTIPPAAEAVVQRQTIERYRLRDPNTAQVGASIEALPVIPLVDSSN